MKYARLGSGNLRKGGQWVHWLLEPVSRIWMRRAATSASSSLRSKLELGRPDVGLAGELPHFVHRRPVADRVRDRASGRVRSLGRRPAGADGPRGGGPRRLSGRCLPAVEAPAAGMDARPLGPGSGGAGRPSAAGDLRRDRLPFRRRADAVLRPGRGPRGAPQQGGRRPRPCGVRW